MGRGGSPFARGPGAAARRHDDGTLGRVHVGFKPLYRPGHIPGAPLHGPTSDPQGLEDLRHWAERIPRSTMVVIYCGCCPLDKCPNVRPAFTLLKTMGFTNLHLLRLTTSFAADWVEKGFPIEATK